MSPLGFGLGVFCICKGLCKLGLFCFKLPLRRLELLAELLELFLYLAHSGLLLFALLDFQGRFVFGLGQCLLERRHFGGGPVTISRRSNFIYYSLYERGESFTFVLFELPPCEAELSLCPL